MWHNSRGVDQQEDISFESTGGGELLQSSDSSSTQFPPDKSGGYKRETPSEL